MKTKAKIILKSLADLPAEAFAFVASVPERAREATRQVFVPSAKLATSGRDTAKLGALVLAPAYVVRSRAPQQDPWPRGGLNE
jgi:hypothetical protein